MALPAEANGRARPRRVADVTASDLDDELVLYNLRTDQVHVLNATAAAIWELCDGSLTADEIAAVLADACSVPLARVQPDVQNMLAEFHQAGLIEFDGHLPSPPRAEGPGVRSSPSLPVGKGAGG
jgi:PqqD family protein of HPr-rel-A system